MDGLRASKYCVKTAYLVVWGVVLLLLAGPVLGLLAPQVGVQSQPGFSLGLEAIQPQLDTALVNTGQGSSNPSHTIVVPVYNNWFFSAGASLSLKFEVNGASVYQTQTTEVYLAPFQSGQLDIVVAPPASALAAMAGKQVAVTGVMSLEDQNLWNFTVSYP